MPARLERMPDWVAAVPSKRPYVPQNWPEHLAIARAENERSRRESAWQAEDRLLLRAVVDLYGQARVENWDGSERGARAGLTEPEKPWSDRRSGRAGETVTIYDLEGNPKEVSLAEAESWWSEIEPQLAKDFRLEREAYERWLAAVSELRDDLLQEALVARVQDRAGESHLVEAQGWRSSLAPKTFYWGYVEFLDVVYGYHQEGSVVLDRSAVEGRLSGTGRDDESREPAPTSTPEPKIDDQRFPYLAFMLRAAEELSRENQGAASRAAIVAWLQSNWPSTLGAYSSVAAESMATFLLPPDEQ